MLFFLFETYFVFENNQNYKQLFTDCSPQVFVDSDASKFCCGAHIMLNKATAHRMWAEHEVSKSSTWQLFIFHYFHFYRFSDKKEYFGIHADNKNTASAVL